jgi:hypothetical protein
MPMVSPSMTLAGPVIWTPAERQDGDETPEHSAALRCQISGRARVIEV